MLRSSGYAIGFEKNVKIQKKKKKMIPMSGSCKVRIVLPFSEVWIDLPL